MAEWSHLPSELLQIIARKLTNICDYIRFRCVCTFWRSAAIPTNLSPQLPWLLLPYLPKSASLSFFNSSDQKIYTLDVSKPHWKLVFGSPHGWLVILEQGKNEEGLTVSLLNPISRAQITLPSLSPALKSPYITKAVLTSNPASSRDCPVLVAIWVHKKLAFCRLGDESWTVIDVGFSYLDGEFAYHRGAFFFVSRGGRAAAFAVDSSEEISIEPQSEFRCPTFQLVESSGELWLLAEHSVSPIFVEIMSRHQFVNKFDTYKLDRGGELKWSWVQGGIRDSLLFVSKKQSMCVCSKDFLGWRTNSGYFASEGFMPDDRLGDVRIPRINLLNIIGCLGLEGHPYYWQAPRRHWTDWTDTTGLTWFIPSLC